MAVYPLQFRSALPTVVMLSLAIAGCSRSPGVRANASDPAKPVAAAVVQKDSVRRSVDVVGTLAAVDQVTVSSEADGKVRGVLADLGDRVKAGQVLMQLDNEKQQYTLRAAAGGARARARAVRRAATRSTCPRSRRPRTCSGPTPISVQAKQAYDRASELFKRTLISQQAFDDARGGAAVEAGGLRRRRCRTPGTCAPASRRRRRR